MEHLERSTGASKGSLRPFGCVEQPEKCFEHPMKVFEHCKTTSIGWCESVLRATRGPHVALSDQKGAVRASSCLHQRPLCGSPRTLCIAVTTFEQRLRPFE